MTITASKDESLTVDLLVNGKKFRYKNVSRVETDEVDIFMKNKHTGCEAIVKREGDYISITRVFDEDPLTEEEMDKYSEDNPK